MFVDEVNRILNSIYPFDRYYRDDEVNIVKALSDLLYSKVANHGCEIVKFHKSSYTSGVFIVYQGSIDPGTIKSKYILTVSEIVNIIKKSFNIKSFEHEVIVNWATDNTHLISYRDTLVVGNLLDAYEYFCCTIKITFLPKYSKNTPLNFNVKYCIPAEVVDYVNI